MSRLIGIDYGSKRIGVSVSDEGRRIATPVSVILNTPILLDEIKKLATDYETNEIVMGESKDYQGRPNVIYPESLEFKKKLEEVGFTVHFEPEFMTSVQAERFQGKSEMTDASAAALILQSYLDRLNSENA